MSSTARLTRDFLLGTLLALCSLLLLPAVTLAAPRASNASTNTTTFYFAFTGLVNGTETALTGGLNLRVRSTGYFNGEFHEPDGTQISVSGQVRGDGSFNITFYTRTGQPFIRGIAGPLNNGEYTGTFKLYQNGNWYDGIWAAIPVSPGKVLSLAFTGEVQRGPDAGLFLSGAIELNSNSLSGFFLLPTGKQIGVRATLLSGQKYDIQVDFGNGLIVGYGKSTRNPANGLDKGYTGPFQGPDARDFGRWTAYFFRFY